MMRSDQVLLAAAVVGEHKPRANQTLRSPQIMEEARLLQCEQDGHFHRSLCY
jgi:hypothetical protein